MSDQPKYDVAISFLHRDEPLALDIYARIGENFSVFVYSKKQEMLAGTDGLESFREAFLNESRVVVVLFRKGWGETPWTRVEQAAITDRFLKDGWDFLLFVSLDDADTPPKWLPKSEIRLSFQQYGLEQLLGAIKVRVQKLGGPLREQTPGERAKVFQTASRSRAEREQLLEKSGNEAFRTEYATIVKELESVIDETNESLTEFEVESSFDGSVFTARAKNTAVNMYPYSSYPITDARLVLQEFDGRLMLKGESGYYFREPKVIGTHKLYFDYQASHGWCWHESKSEKYLSARLVAELLIDKLLRLQERFDKREIRKNRDINDD